jgi:hypothetical protein
MLTQGDIGPSSKPLFLIPNAFTVSKKRKGWHQLGLRKLLAWKVVIFRSTKGMSREKLDLKGRGYKQPCHSRRDVGVIRQSNDCSSGHVFNSTALWIFLSMGQANMFVPSLQQHWWTLPSLCRFGSDSMGKCGMRFGLFNRGDIVMSRYAILWVSIKNHAIDKKKTFRKDERWNWIEFVFVRGKAKMVEVPLWSISHNLSIV